jgi:hypothetical protein
MRILVACEYSGRVRDAFIRRGHDAWSCDLLPTDVPGPHFQRDVLEVIENNGPWDMLIAFPPCTYLCVSGMHWTTRGLRDPKLTEDALEFVRRLMNSSIPRIALENPIGVISTRIRKPDQIIQPWQFGEDASKKTCLWLRNLPRLEATTIIPPKGWNKVSFAADMLECEACAEPYCPECEDHYADCKCIGPDEEGVLIKKIDGWMFGSRITPAPKPVWANQTASGQNKLTPSDSRWKERSETYLGVAEAMAEQWGQ